MPIAMDIKKTFMNSKTNKIKGVLRKEILGVPIDICNDVLKSAIELHALGGGQIITLNTEMAMLARTNQTLKKVISTSELVIPDSIGLVAALRLKKLIVSRAPGIELANDLLLHAEANHWRVALVGGSKDVMSQLKKNLFRNLPNLKIELAIHGFHNEYELHLLEKKLKDIDADLILIAMGTPFQEIWSQKIRRGCRGIWIGVGGSFDIWAGKKSRAPSWIRRIHLEWLYRLIKEPSRINRFTALAAFPWVLFKTEEACEKTSTEAHCCLPYKNKQEEEKGN